jgi:hypothetical protein
MGIRKFTFRALLLVAAGLVVLSAAGCGAAQKAVSDGGAQTPQTAVASTVSAPSTEAPTTESTTPTTEPAPTTTTTEGMTEANWTLEVSDTQTAKINGYDFTCTLSIMAIKLGGTDGLGTYRGIVTFDYEYNMEQGNISGNAKGSGQEIDAIIEVVKFDADTYTGGDPLAPLSAFDGMSIGSLSLKGSGVSNEQAGGATWSTGETKTITTPYKLTVEGGQVQIILTGIAPGTVFQGMITGTPI